MAPKITLYSYAAPTPNPMKIRIMLEELNIEYAVVNLEPGEGPNGLKGPNFLKINPNGRIPAIIDHTHDDHAVWESGAILLYLAERFDTDHKFNGVSLKERAEVLEWLIFQVSGLGPSQGQANWFLRYHAVQPPELHPSVIERYQNETRRIYGVFEKRLEEAGDWIALGRFTIVDMANFPWLLLSPYAEVDISAFPKLEAYVARIKALPSVEKAYSKVPALPQEALATSKKDESVA